MKDDDAGSAPGGQDPTPARERARREIEAELRQRTEDLARLNAELAIEIRERQWHEQALRRSESQFRTIVENSLMGIHSYRLEEDGRLVFVGANAAADRILGVDHRQFVGKPIEQAFPSLAGTEIVERYRRACALGESWSAEQVDYQDERIRGAFEVHAFQTAPGMMAALFLDVTERRRGEKALRESEEKYRLLVESAGDGIFIAQDGKVAFSNRRAAEMVGYLSAGEVEGRSFLDFIAPEDHDLVRERYRRRLEGEAVPSTYELRLRRRDNEIFWTQLNAVRTTWEGRPATLNFIRDISAQKKMEAQLYLAERMQSIGTLAGGVAHDFNNILMGIQGNTSLLLLQMDPAHPSYHRVREIERCVDSGAELTAQILGFARGGKYQVVPTDLNRLIGETTQMFGRARKEIALHVRCQEGLWAVEVDRSQIEQVFLNLFVNAWQAMPRGGDLFVESRNVVLGGAEVGALGAKPGRYVRIVVRDTGHGIDPAVQVRVFDPFFTTKERGRGTGLGLASAYGIVRNHGGAIRVESEPGRGATFSVLLPATDKPVEEPAGPAAAGVVHGSGTVLLVDDEPQIADVCRELLEHLGYEVLTAGGGREAVEVYRANRGLVDAVVLDMVMPDMTGGETFDRLRAIDPGVRVLLSSGYSLDSQARDILARGCDDFIQKPYTLGALSRKLKGVLERR